MVRIEYSSIVLVANYCRVPALISICNGMYTSTMLIMTISLSATITHDTGFGSELFPRHDPTPRHAVQTLRHEQDAPGNDHA